MLVELVPAGTELVARRETDDDGRIAESRRGASSPGAYQLVFHPPSPFFARVELEIELGDGHHHVPLLVSPYGARATAEADRRRARRALRGPHALRRAARRARATRSTGPTTSSQALSREDKVEALDAHPAIGQRTGLSARSAAEQGTDADPAVLAELADLNEVYEEKFGFRFVVFVDGRPKQEILEVLRGRIGRTEDEELDTGCRELIAIARDRWTRT